MTSDRWPVTGRWSAAARIWSLVTGHRSLRRLRPGSVAAQSAALLIGSILVAHVLFAITWILVAPADRRFPPEERTFATEVAMALRMIDSVPGNERAALIASASSPSLSITFQGTAPRLLSGDAAGEAAPEEAILAVVRHQAGDRPITLISGRAADPRELRDRPIIAAQIGDGWLVFRGPPRTRFRGPFGIYSFPVSALLLIGIPLVTLSLWAARRLISPLARLAQASETLSLEGALLPIPANAPVEIRRLAGSFNALVGRLQKFAADRTGMLAAISHDLRTPLTRLRLRTEQLDDDLLRAKMLRDIRAMEEMITSTLAYVDQQRVPGPAEQLDLAALLQTLCDEFADAGFDVTYAGPLHCPAAGRPGALERALNNLIENAIKFGDAAALTLDDSGACLVIDVCDDGPGVPDEEKEHVLKPFYRVDTARNDAKGGIGLGLAIASAIAQSHGGQLELRDREPHGLCVRMTLPRPARTARIGLAA